MSHEQAHILVTGGSRGIGRGMVTHLVQKGYQVSFIYNRSQKAAEELIHTFSDSSTTLHAYQCDIRDYQQAKETVQRIIEEQGPIDGLVNNSGLVKDRSLFMMDEEHWRTVIDTNLTGMYNVTRSVITHFLKKKKGNIVNISSVAGLVGTPGQTNYSASKSGIIGFTKSLATEVARYGINVNAVAPGYINTEMVQNMPERKRDTLFESIPVGYVGEVEDVAHLVHFLLSEQSRYITGQVITVDGGLTA
ncbi:3-oxoacyl-ACP reductase FabG [Caldalkalibacillus salinus]|uniref:3-oxoacyl-ACP reductase FabG n=1 Tax=Caldalkalibacillus salinus TaxID=2803787 RepID=UPI0019232ED2|nr:3-oxoacyl-ACP reductase FabG [Caldalkalibacillus salinus]